MKKGGRWMRERFTNWVIIIAGATLLGAVGIVGLFQIVRAVPSSSLTFQNPVIFSSDVVPAVAETTCTKPLSSLTIAGEITPRDMCMTEGNGIRFGIYPTGHGYGSVIGFGFDTQMYHLWAGCDRENSCIYVPSSDMLIVKKPVRFFNSSLNIYKDFSKHVMVQQGQNPLIREYYFDTTQPDYTFRTNDQITWPVGGMGVSDNGNWLAVELMDKGIGVLNLHTFEMEKISDFKFSYWTGYNPSTEFAVSNDGAHVAIMGLNAWIIIYDIADRCGEKASDEIMTNGTPLAHPCLSAPIDVFRFAPQFRYATQPKFDDAGGELSFYTLGGEPRYVALRAAGYEGDRLDYLALGDSFNSGEGETSDDHYEGGTNNPYEKCHVSGRSYPFLIAQALLIAPNLMKSVACSGAVTGDVVGVNARYWGQGGRLSTSGLNLSVADKTSAQASALDLFLPGRVKQVTFVKKYHPKVVTIGIGGNDAGFMQKLRACLGPDTCDWAATPVGREKTALEVQRLFDTLVGTYQELVAASPSSKIYAVGYPKVIDEEGSCDLLTGYLLNSDEKRFMNEGITYINQVVASAAKRAGILYLDVESSFGRQALCGDGRPSAMNGIVAGDDNAISDKLSWFKIIGQESFHPTPTGHSLIATSILRAVPNLLQYDNCAGGAVVCPMLDTTAPDPSAYWSLDSGSAHLPRQQSVAYVYDHDGASDKTKKTIMLADHLLQPGSFAKVEVNSEPVTLGEFTVSDNGSLRADIDLPDDLVEGYHTVHLYGTSYSGEPIDAYDVILYVKPDISEPGWGNGDTGEGGGETTGLSPKQAGSTRNARVIDNSKTTSHQMDIALSESSSNVVLKTPNILDNTTTNSPMNEKDREGVLGSNTVKPEANGVKDGWYHVGIWVALCALGLVAVVGAWMVAKGMRRRRE